MTFIRFFRWGLCFRINGSGLVVQRDLPRLFSERYGYRKVWRAGRWSIELLRKP